MIQWAWYLLLSLCATYSFAQENPLALIGTILMSHKIVKNGTLLIVNGRIAAVGAHVHIPNNANIIYTNGVILPGLIDLHNHLTWNVFPRWKPIEEFGSRYAWRQTLSYKTSMEAPHQALVKAGLSCEMQRYAEIKAITQGTTSVIGSLRQPCNRGLARNIDDDPTLGNNIYSVFPLEMTDTELNNTGQILSANGTLLIHLAEGSPNDATATHEFPMLKSRGLLLPGVSLIHAVALKVTDFDQMAQAGVGLVWSPRSNLELYGETTNMKAVRDSGVMTALAPDWSPTGSDGLLSELNYAATWNAALERPLFDDRLLVDMATVNPAKLVHLDKRLGALKEGLLADILILRPKDIHSDLDALWTVTHATPEDVALVVIDGKAVYGDFDVIKKVTNTAEFESLEICGITKYILLPKQRDSAHTFRVTQRKLNSALRQLGRKLAPLSECGN